MTKPTTVVGLEKMLRSISRDRAARTCNALDPGGGPISETAAGASIVLVTEHYPPIKVRVDNIDNEVDQEE